VKDENRQHFQNAAICGATNTKHKSVKVKNLLKCQLNFFVVQQFVVLVVVVVVVIVINKCYCCCCRRRFMLYSLWPFFQTFVTFVNTNICAVAQVFVVPQISFHQIVF